MTKISGLTGRSTFELTRFDLCQMGNPIGYEFSIVIMCFNPFLNHFFSMIKIKRFKKLTIGKLPNVFIGPRYANKLLDIIIPGSNVFIPYGPITTHTILEIGIKVEIT